MRGMGMSIFDTYLTTPRGVRSAVPAVARHIVARGKGYIVKVGEDWYEVSVTACEPPDSGDDAIQDAVL